MDTLLLSCFPCFRLFDLVLYQTVIVNDLFELLFYKKKKKRRENCTDISCNYPKVLNREPKENIANPHQTSCNLITPICIEVCVDTCLCLSCIYKKTMLLYMCFISVNLCGSPFSLSFGPLLRVCGGGSWPTLKKS